MNTLTTRQMPLEALALGLALSAFDAVATWAWLTLGLATEVNPFLTSLIDAQGLVAAMGTRALMGLVWFSGFHLLSKRSKIAFPAAGFAIGVLAVVAIQHVRILAITLGG